MTLVDTAAVPAPVVPAGGSLEIRGLTKDFGETRVLHGIDLVVPAGTTTCLIGPSGSGKSTVLRCVDRLEAASGGAVLLDGTDVLQGPEDALRRRVGMVFQHFNLFPHRTVLDNLVLPLRRVRRLSRADAVEVAHRRLAEVGLADKADVRPASLSGGQKQRVAIARALALEPEVMLFDEATSALDPELVKGVLDLMRGLADGGMTMLVVTHEMGFARSAADQVVFMDRGVVVESGDPATVFDAPRTDRLKGFLAQVL